MIKPLNIDYNPSRLGQNNEQLSSNLDTVCKMDIHPKLNAPQKMI